MERRLGEWAWRLDPSWTFLLEPGAPNWTQLEKDPRATQVKSNDGRHVWRVQLERGLVFVKVNKPARKWPRLRRRIFGTDAQRESRVAAYAAAHGIDAIRAVACAEAPISGRRPISILVTAGLPRALPLNDLWSALDLDDAATRQVKNHIIDEVARLLAHAHQNGFEHYDLHAGNVLLDELPSGRHRPLFVDLHSVRTGKAVTDRVVIRNLAQFNQWFRLHAPLTDRIRFLNRYLFWRDRFQSEASFGRRLPFDREEILRRLEGAALAHANTLYAKRDRRVLRTGRYFGRITSPGGWRGNVYLEAKHAVPGSRASQMVFTMEQWRRWLADPLRWVKPADRRDLLKDSATAIVCRAKLPHEQGSLEVVAKHGRPKTFGKKLQSLFRPSRARATWQRANALLHRQILTARPLALIERKRFGVLIDSVMIAERVDPAIDLDTLLTVTMREMPGQRQRLLKEQLATGLLTVTRQLLERGYRHRDFKAPNIIVQWDPAADAPPQIVLVDLDGVLPLWFSRQRAAMQMLMRLNVSLDHCRRVTRTDRLRFLKRFLSRYGQPAGDWKAAWRELGAQSDRKRTNREKSQQRKFEKYGRF